MDQARREELDLLLYYSGKLLGSATATRFDPPMGCAGGEFRPTEDYALIQPIVLEKNRYSIGAESETEEGRSFWERYSSLELTVKTQDGELLELAGGIDLTDASDVLGPEDSMELWVLGLDHSVFNRLFPGEYERYEEPFRDPGDQTEPT